MSTNGSDGIPSRSLGHVIRQRRIELGMTQEELAERVGDNVRQSDISRLERGSISLPRRSRLEAIATALQVTPGYLLLHSNWFGKDETSIPDFPAPGRTPASRQVEEEVGDPPVDNRDEVPETSELAQAISRARAVARRTNELLERSSEVMSDLHPPEKQE